MRRLAALLFFFAAAASARPPAVARIHASGQSVVEGNSGLTSFTVVVSLPFALNNDMSGSYSTADGTATLADQDYVQAKGTFVIPAGKTDSAPITLQIVGDTKVEPDEFFTFTVHFQDPTLDPPPYVITIVNDDIPVVTVSGDVRVNEGNAGLTPMPFDVTLVSPSAVPVVVNFQTRPNTATENDDYQGVKGTFTFQPGQTKQTITVNIIGDTAFESDEDFFLDVTPVGGATVSGRGVIVNDDLTPPGALVIVSGNNQQGRLGQTLPQPLVVKVVDQNGQPIPGVPVQWSVTKGDATLSATTNATDAVGRASTLVTLNSVGAVEVTVKADRFTVRFTLGSTTSFADRATGPVAVPIARVLDGICARNEQTFASACRALAQLSDAALTPALERVAPQESGAQSKVASEVISAVTAGIGARLAAVRTGVQRLSISDLELDLGGRSVPISAMASAFLPKPMTSAAGAQDDYNGWSAFLSGNLGSGHRITHPGELGFDLRSRGLMAGVDRQFGENIFGLSLNVMRLDSDLTEGAGSVDVDGYALSLYGSRGGLGTRGTPSTGSGFHYDGVHVDGSLTAGRNRYKSEHVVDITGLPLSVATSNNDGSVVALSGVTGIDAHRGRGEFDVSVGGTWSRAHVADLTEDGSGPLILFVQGHDIDSLTGTASLSAKGAWAVPFGTLLPTFRVEMVHEFKSAARLVTAHFVRDSLGTSFTIPLDQPDRNYARLAAGLQAVFARGVSLHIEGSQDVSRNDLKYRNVQLTLSKSF